MPNSSSFRPETQAISAKRPLPVLLRAFWLWIILCTVVTLVTTWFYRHRGLSGYPYNGPFFQQYSYQFDFNCYSERIKYFGTEQFFHQVNSQDFSYPAILALVYKFFYLFGVHAHTLFLSTVIGVFTLGAFFFSRALIRQGIAPLTAYSLGATLLLTSYPLGILLYLANMEGVVWVATALGVYSYVKHRSWAAAVFFGIAGAMKIFPLVYLGLLLAQKQYRQTILGVAVFAVANVVSLAVLGPTIAIAFHGLSDGVLAFQREYVYHFWSPENSMDHSLFAWFKLPLKALHRTGLLQRIAAPYLATVALAGVALYVAKLRKLPPINLVTVLAIVSVLLPEVSHDYTLVHLYAPFTMLALLLVRGRVTGEALKAARSMIACYILLFTAQNYLIVHHVRVAGQFKSAVLILLFFTAVVHPLVDETPLAPSAA